MASTDSSTAHAKTCACPPCFASHVERWKERDDTTEADAHDAAVEHYSTTPHEHQWIQTGSWMGGSGIPTTERLGPVICRLCGGWRERIEGRVTA